MAAASGLPTTPSLTPKLPAAPSAPQVGTRTDGGPPPPTGGGSTAMGAGAATSSGGVRNAPTFANKKLPTSQFGQNRPVPEIDIQPLKQPDSFVTIEFCLEQMHRVLTELAEGQEDPVWVESHRSLAEQWMAAAGLLLQHAQVGHAQTGDMELKQQQLYQEDELHQQTLSHNDQKHFQDVRQGDDEHKQRLKQGDDQHKQKLAQGEDQHGLRLKQQKETFAQSQKDKAQAKAQARSSSSRK